MDEELIRIKNDAISLILDSEEVEDLEQVSREFLGKTGRLTLYIRNVSNLSVEKRPEYGMLANEIKKTIEEAIKNKRFDSKKTFQKQSNDTIDISLPGIKPLLGNLHLVTQAIEEITAIFSHIGFKRVRYPEVEWDWYAFGALNFPEGHPARDDWETFFIDAPKSPRYGPMVLTPHTSSGQIREMQKGKLPIRMLNIGKCYRRQSDVSHTQMFHQFEGLVIAEDINISHLKGVLDYFVRSYFGEKRTFRIRPYHFQFTEPSFEIDITCGVCLGKGCRLCKGGWLELGGSGMVHPNVLEAVNIDPKKYTGFAFGWGVERVLMMREGLKIDDLRTLYSNNLDFLEQF